MNGGWRREAIGEDYDEVRSFRSTCLLLWPCDELGNDSCGKNSFQGFNAIGKDDNTQKAKA